MDNTNSTLIKDLVYLERTTENQERYLQAYELLITDMQSILKRMHPLVTSMASQHTWDEMSDEEREGDIEGAWDIMVENSRALLKLLKEYEEAN